MYEDFDDARGDYGESNPGLTLDPFDSRNGGDNTQHTFPAGTTWTPERLHIHERRGRRAVCVLAQDKLRYRVYDLDSSTADLAEEVFPMASDPEDAVMT